MPSNEQIDADRACYDEENLRIPRYRRYARGRQDNMLTENQAHVLGADVCDDERADNIVHQIVSEGADRVELLGIDVEEGAQGAAELTDFIKKLWVKNALPDLAGEQSYDTLLAGNSAVMVRFQPNGGPDFGRVVFTLEPWWDGCEGVWYFDGDEENEPYAVKEVFQRQTVEEAKAGTRPKVRFVYYDNRIMRFRKVSDGAQAWEPDETPMYPGGVMPWIRPDGRPLHIPIVPFHNAGRMWGYQGLSEASGGLIANQNDLNLIDASAAAAAILTAFQILWMNNYPFRRDADGNILPEPPLTLEPGTTLRLLEGGQAGAVPAGSVEQILKAKDDKIVTISRASRTPRHAITGGDWPSGDALVRAEQPAVSAARRRAAKWGPAWATVFHRATELANVFGKRQLNEDALLTAKWGDFERRDPLYTLQVKSAERKGIDEQKRLDAGEPLTPTAQPATRPQAA
jgi:hypothetical protein